MNYSDKTYGRKTIKRKKRKQFLGNAFAYLIFVIIGSLLITGIIHLFGCTQTPKDVVPYGVIDESAINEEVVDWKSEIEDDFIPLDVPMDEELQEFVYYMSCAYDIDFPLVMALIKTESDFNPSLVSSTNDYGIMQINTCNHENLRRTIGVTDFLDPYQSIQSGMFMLRRLFDKYEDPVKVLMAYNMGEGGAGRLWKKGVFESNYSRKIMKTAVEYQQQISEKKGGESNV